MILTSEALGKSAPRAWKLLLFVPALIIYIFGIGVVFETILSAVSSPENQIFSDELYDMETPRALMISLGTIAILHLFVWFWVSVVHRRGYWQFLNPSNVRIRDAIKEVGFYFGMTMLLTIVVTVFLPINHSFHYVANWQIWLIWFIPLSAMIVLQASAEEAVFRGYLQQYIAHYFPNFWVFGVLPSVLFGFLHFFNFPEDPFLAWAATIAISVFGIIMADWARVTKSLLGPIIYHSLNNIFLIVFIGNSLEPSDMHLLRIDYSQANQSQLALVFLVEVFISASVYIAFRKYYLQPRAEKKRLEQLHLEATKPISYVD